MIKKCPYNFPLRSRKAMTAYLAEHEHYWPMNSNNGGFVLSWDVKIHFNFDMTGKKCGEPVNPAYDEQWQEYLENDDIFNMVCEDTARSFAVLDKEYTTYPGDDQGNYEFAFNGRSGGHLCLYSCTIVNHRGWSCGQFVFDSRGDWEDYLQDLSFDNLKKLYRAIACMDQDFTQEKIRKEIEYQYNFQRTLWEEEQERKQEKTARCLEAKRPDLYV